MSTDISYDKQSRDNSKRDVRLERERLAASADAKTLQPPMSRRIASSAEPPIEAHWGIGGSMYLLGPLSKRQHMVGSDRTVRVQDRTRHKRSSLFVAHSSLLPKSAGREQVVNKATNMARSSRWPSLAADGREENLPSPCPAFQDTCRTSPVEVCPERRPSRRFQSAAQHAASQRGPARTRGVRPPLRLRRRK